MGPADVANFSTQPTANFACQSASNSVNVNISTAFDSWLTSNYPASTGSAWQYHTFKQDASERLTGKGFMRLKVTQP